MSLSPRSLTFLLLLLLGNQAASFSARAASPTATIDLLNSQPSTAGDVTRVFGHDYGGSGNFGVPVAGGADVDGDGFNDFGFGQMTADVGTMPVLSDAGQMTLVFGDGTIGAAIDSDGFDPAYLKIIGTQTRETVGNEIWIDDVTGDGLGDVLIGRQNYTPGSGRDGAGALTLIIGDADLKNHTAGYFDLANPPADVKLVTFIGVSAFDRLGIWMRTGDIDGDGIADIAVGADETDDPAGSGITDNSGAVWIIRGGPHLATAPAVIDLADFGTTSLAGHLALVLPPVGNSADYHLASTVTVADLDNNGRCEVIAAAALNRAGASLRLPTAPGFTSESQGGSAYGSIFISWDENFPASPWPAEYTFDIADPLLGDFTRIDGPNGPSSLPDSFGEEIVVGDFSGDGFPDLFVGDLVGDGPNGTNSGLGYTFYNAINLRGRTIDVDALPVDVPMTTNYGPMTGAIGSDTVVVGDFDKDGVDDLAVGNPCNDPQGRGGAGSISVFFGQPGGWPAIIDESPGNFPAPDVMRITEIHGAFTNDVLCYSAASGDIDQDGTIDLIVNEMKGNGFGGSPPSVGNLLVIDGSILLPPFAPSLDIDVTGPVDYGAQDTGGGPTNAVTITLTNLSGATINVTSLGIEGPQSSSFAITSDNADNMLDDGEARIVSVAFDPPAEGVHGAALALTTDADTHRITVGLRGTGIDPDIDPVIDDIFLFDNETCVRFASQLGYTYRLRRSTDLVNWSTIINDIVGTGGLMPLFDVGAPASPEFFYRVEGEAEPTP